MTYPQLDKISPIGNLKYPIGDIIPNLVFSFVSPLITYKSKYLSELCLPVVSMNVRPFRVGAIQTFGPEIQFCDESIVCLFVFLLRLCFCLSTCEPWHPLGSQRVTPLGRSGGGSAGRRGSAAGPGGRSLYTWPGGDRLGQIRIHITAQGAPKCQGTTNSEGWYLAHLGQARGCYTNTLVIKCFID